MTPRFSRYQISRRRFIQGVSVTALAAACGRGEEAPTQQTPSGAAPEEVFNEPASQLSGDLRLLNWSHFVPAHDEWFDDWATEWGEQVGVNVTVDHIDVTQIPARISSEIAAGEGHDLIMYIATLSQFEPSVHSMNDLMDEANSRFGEQVPLCQKSSFNPTTENYYAYAPAWTPDPGDYRKSLWEQADLPDGPSTWDELLEGGGQIFSEQDIQMGLGMSQEIDSNMYARALIWSYGGAVQDENENVTLMSDDTIAAVEYSKELFEGAMTEEVFAWNPASNNEGLVAGQLSYILNSISAWRTAQESIPDIARDIYFVPALEGPKAAIAAQHVMYNWISPTHSTNFDAAQEFLLHYTANLARVAYESKLYDLPGYPDQVPQLDGWLDEDPFAIEGDDATKLQPLKTALDWATNLGHPGPANPAIGEINGTFVLPNMLARVARGRQEPEQSVEQAHQECEQIFTKWRREGLIGGA
ncbi:MAG TPA: extracellular solute-binding protein [Actinomycetota bacterium]|nr:extracellular solute-binding protein [Actinomycetota bacterium]